VAVLAATLSGLPFREFIETRKRVTGPTASLFIVHLTSNCGPLAGFITLESFTFRANKTVLFVRDRSGHCVLC
jgi:hypothetical protein